MRVCHAVLSYHRLYIFVNYQHSSCHSGSPAGILPARAMLDTATRYVVVMLCSHAARDTLTQHRAGVCAACRFMRLTARKHDAAEVVAVTTAIGDDAPLLVLELLAVRAGVVVYVGVAQVSVVATAPGCAARISGACHCVHPWSTTACHWPMLGV